MAAVTGLYRPISPAAQAALDQLEALLGRRRVGRFPITNPPAPAPTLPAEETTSDQPEK